MERGAKRSRAAAELAAAPASPCPHCGRTTKTVQGVCADCWGVKDPEVAVDLRPPPKTEPLLGPGSVFDDLLGVGPIVLVVGLPLLLAAVVAVVFLGLR